MRLSSPKFLGELNRTVIESIPKSELHRTKNEYITPFSATRAFFQWYSSTRRNLKSADNCANTVISVIGELMKTPTPKKGSGSSIIKRGRKLRHNT